jgi:iron complex transport system ATP-binding protein
VKGGIRALFQRQGWGKGFLGARGLLAARTSQDKTETDTDQTDWAKASKAVPCVLEAADLAIGYTRPRQPPIQVLDGIELSLRSGELVCLLGPNGAGKSTLMRTLAGMQSPLAGSVRLDGSDLHAMEPRCLARRLSLVLTDRVEVGRLSGRDIVSLGRHPYTGWSGRLSLADRRVVQWALDSTGSATLANCDMAELSDGERQKIMIARALAQQPGLVLLDEPTAFLDLPRRVEIMRLLGRLAREKGLAVLLSTHDLELALRLADRLWLLPPGGPLQAGAPEDLVLNGGFARTFTGIDFEVGSGTFGVGEPNRGTISMNGEGAVALWTKKALARAGWRVVQGMRDGPRIEISQGADTPIWQVWTGAGERQCGTLLDVVECLRQQQLDDCS